MLKKVGCAVRFALVATVLSAVAGAVHADIAAFNEAYRRGDYKAATEAAKSTWPTLDKTDAYIAETASGFGFTSLVSGDFQAAYEFGKFLVENGAGLPSPDQAPQTSAVLFATANFRLQKGAEELRALRVALNARSEVPGADMISVLGWQALYTSSMGLDGLDVGEADAKAAADFYARDPVNYLTWQRDAEVTWLATTFLQRSGRITKQRNELYENMADLHDVIVRDLAAGGSAGKVKALWDSKWAAEAWSLAIASWLKSTYSQVGSNINSDVEIRPLLQPPFAQYPEDPSAAGLPLCDGRFDGKALSYPANRQFMGLVGSVIARMETGADGKVTDVEIMAAVPFEGFRESVERTLRTWTYKPAKGVARSSCRLNSRNQMLKVIFRMG